MHKKQRVTEAGVAPSGTVVPLSATSTKTVGYSRREFYLSDSDGQLLDRFVEDPTKPPKTRDWSRILDRAFRVVATKDYSAAMFRVLLYVLSELRWGNYVTVSQTQIAEKTGLGKSSVSRAMTRLVDDRILLSETDARHAGMRAYKLNANFGYKGANPMWAHSKRRDGDMR